MNCWSCGLAVEGPDRYCRHCGMGLGENLPWYYHPGWITVLALFAAGPFVLPLVWKSPKISPTGKKIGTALLGLLTLYLVYGFFRAMAMLQNVLAGAVNLNGLQ